MYCVHIALVFFVIITIINLNLSVAMLIEFFSKLHKVSWKMNNIWKMYVHNFDIVCFPNIYIHQSEYLASAYRMSYESIIQTCKCKLEFSQLNLLFICVLSF